MAAASMQSHHADALDLGSWRATPEFVREYLETVGDESAVYGDGDIAPPMALAAKALAALIEKLELPPGTVHTSQEVTSFMAAPVGSELTASATPSRPFKRGDWRFLSVSFIVAARQGDSESVVITGKSTVMTPDGGSADE